MIDSVLSMENAHGFSPARVFAAERQRKQARIIVLLAFSVKLYSEDNASSDWRPSLGRR
jgi:hypothetical protein